MYKEVKALKRMQMTLEDMGNERSTSLMTKNLLVMLPSTLFTCQVNIQPLTTHSTCWWSCGKKALGSVDGEIEMRPTLRRGIWQYLAKIYTSLLFDPDILLLRIDLRYMTKNIKRIFFKKAKSYLLPLFIVFFKVSISSAISNLLNNKSIWKNKLFSKKSFSRVPLNFISCYFLQSF